jgi:hypothetical protein
MAVCEELIVQGDANLNDTKKYRWPRPVTMMPKLDRLIFRFGWRSWCLSDSEYHKRLAFARPSSDGITQDAN